MAAPTRRPGNQSIGGGMGTRLAALTNGLLAHQRVTPASVGLFEGIFRQHYPRVVRIAAALVGPDEADDIAQEVFLRLDGQAILERPDPEIAAWLHRVTMNEAYNQLRSRRRRQARHERAEAHERPEAAWRQAALDPARAITSAEHAALVRQAVAKLPANQRSVLVLRHAGLSYAEIAAAVGIAVSSVGTLLNRAERRIRDEFTRLDQAPVGRSQPE